MFRSRSSGFRRVGCAHQSFCRVRSSVGCVLPTTRDFARWGEVSRPRHGVGRGQETRAQQGIPNDVRAGAARLAVKPGEFPIGTCLAGKSLYTYGCTLYACIHDPAPAVKRSSCANLPRTRHAPRDGPSVRGVRGCLLALSTSSPHLSTHRIPLHDFDREGLD
jgi:hypothetical protein